MPRARLPRLGRILGRRSPARPQAAGSFFLNVAPAAIPLLPHESFSNCSPLPACKNTLPGSKASPSTAARARAQRRHFKPITQTTSPTATNTSSTSPKTATPRSPPRRWAPITRIKQHLPIGPHREKAATGRCRGNMVHTLRDHKRRAGDRRTPRPSPASSPSGASPARPAPRLVMLEPLPRPRSRRHRLGPCWVEKFIGFESTPATREARPGWARSVGKSLEVADRRFLCKSPW